PSGGRAVQAPPMSGPSTLPPSERTVALDIDAPGGHATAAPNESTMALDSNAAAEFLHSGGAGPVADGGPTMGSLVIFAQNAQPVVYELGNGVTSIGRGLENNVVLSDPYSSRKHFLVVHRD